MRVRNICKKLKNVVFGVIFAGALLFTYISYGRAQVIFNMGQYGKILLVNNTVDACKKMAKNINTNTNESKSIIEEGKCISIREKLNRRHIRYLALGDAA
jgi:hypothetical protein